MSIRLEGPTLISFGFRKLGDTAEERHLAIALNVLNSAGIIPLIGTITGIYRLVLAKECFAENNDETKTLGKVMFFRGIVEILGVGVVLTPVDIGVTAARIVRDCIQRQKGYHQAPEAEKVHTQ